MRFRNILVGVDLSRADRLAATELNPPTQEAVRQAIRTAAHLSAPLTFFAALDVSVHAESLLRGRLEEASQTVADAANQALAELVAQAKREGVEAQGTFVFGRAWEEIIRQVLRDGHDLVMVGTRDAGSASRWLFGSTAMKLLRQCPCPVWVTRPDPNPDDVNILVACDLSETSQHLLHLAVDCGRLLDAKVHLVHAIEHPYETLISHTGVSDDDLQAYRQRIRDEAEQALHQQLSQTDYRTLPYGVKVHLIDGPPEVVILEAIEEFGIDLLVMGTAARSGLGGLLVGNTAERLLAEIPCSVLAVKPPDFKTPVELEEESP